jgi:urea transport system permease protein
MHKQLAILTLVFGLLPVGGMASVSPERTNLVQAILSEDTDEQAASLKQLATANDPWIEQILAAWRQGAVYIFETNDTRTPFMLEASVDANGRAKGLRVLDGQSIADMRFEASELTAADTNAKLRKAIKTTLDLFALNKTDRRMRRDAVVKIGQEQNPEHLAPLEAKLKVETDPEVRKALREAIATTHLASEDANVRLDAVNALREMRSLNGLVFLQALPDAKERDSAARGAIKEIEDYMWRGNLIGTAFRGLSLSAVLLVAALGLAITFGLMRIINMAHGEIMMVGAYTTYCVQSTFRSWFGAGTTGFESYFLAALAVSFVTAGIVGLILERCVIRFLYKRPLESLLATWGVSLVLQQMFRHVFGAANVQVSSPEWLSGSFVTYDVLFAYNRLFVIGFAGFIVLGTFLLLTRTSLGLQIRASMQNRAMASCLGVRTQRVNMLTFAFGCGLAGMAGACLSQIGNVGPGLGQNYIVDCFMVVVLGGVGNLMGTILAAFGIGVTDQIMQPFLGAVMGKILVLGAIILFLQWRPAGLFVTRTRNLED